MKKTNQKSQYRPNKKIKKDNTLIIPEKKSNSVHLYILAFALPVLLYIQTINFGFVNFDDDKIIVSNIDFLSHFKNAHRVFFTDALVSGHAVAFYRPLQTLSYMIDIQLSGGNNTWMYHLTNTLLLGLIACSLLILLTRFLIPPKLALLGTLIYCAHPLFLSTVAWIPARGDLMLTFFSLLSCLFFIEFIRKGNISYLFLNWVTFTIALFCKETAALLPVIFILYYFAFPHQKPFEKKYLFSVILYAASGLVWFSLRSNAVRGYSDRNGLYGIEAFISNLRIIPESLIRFFLPVHIDLIPVFSVLMTILGLSLIVIIFIIVIKNRGKFLKEKLFCFGWFLILMFPPMLYKSLRMDYLNHRFFLPLIGVLLFLLFLFPEKWFNKGDIKKSWFLIAVFIFLCSLTFIQSHSYSDPMTFYNSAIKQNPNSAIAHYNRGALRLKKNDFQGAVEDFSKTIDNCDYCFEAYDNRGIANNKLGNYKDAIDDFSKFIAVHPNNADAISGRGSAMFLIGNYKDALNDFNKAIAIRPDDAEIYYNKGLANNSLGNFKEAIVDFGKAINLRPGYSEAYDNKGAAFISMGNLKEAIICFNKAIEIDSNNVEAICNRAITKFNLKDFTGALNDCEKALKLNPNDKQILGIKAQAQQEIKHFNL